jgi:uncharacterized protein YutE (UPF0331/DUF86 family)
MTAGPIDLKVVSDRLSIVRGCIADLQRIPAADLAQFASDFRNPATAESLLRRAIEALLDTARHLLSKAYGLAALEYREVARQAGARGLIEDEDLQRRFVDIAGFRNRLTHFYDQVTPQELFSILSDELDDLGRIAEQLAGAASRLASRRS